VTASVSGAVTAAAMHSSSMGLPPPPFLPQAGTASSILRRASSLNTRCHHPLLLAPPTHPLLLPSPYRPTAMPLLHADTTSCLLPPSPPFPPHPFVSPSSSPPPPPPPHSPSGHAHWKDDGTATPGAVASELDAHPYVSLTINTE
jgi:hypothetical protein